MELTVIAVGRLKAGPETELCGRYLDRARKAGQSLGFRGFGVTEIAEVRGARPAERMSAEGVAILTAGAGIPLLCLDEGGDLVSSNAFAAMLRAKADAGAPALGFVIGGPDGLDRSALQAAQGSVSFGRMTWPHQLVRVMLAEQLYRAMTILSGHPYHRA